MIANFFSKIKSINELYEALFIIFLVGVSFLIKIIFSKVFLPIIKKIIERTPVEWDDLLFEYGFFAKGAFFLTALIFSAMMRFLADSTTVVYQIAFVTTQLVLIVFAVLTIFTIIDTLREITKNKYSKTPLILIFQVLKIALVSIAAIIGLSIVAGRSPALIVSGLGAMTAVLMLVFKDPIVGFVAGIQLSANKMVDVGDWLEMPKYNADGDVIEITLTTVKVANWDKTITTIPTSALITDSFKNWKGMVDSGGRRIKRSVFIDVNTVKFLNEEGIENLRKLKLLKSYMEDKTKEIEKHNEEQNVSPDLPIDGRQLTNLGTFRAYLSHYLENHPKIHKNLTAMVRQLQSTPEGIPLEIYCFTNDTRWVIYESIQADIFDHIFAVAPSFGLRVYQSPGAADLTNAAELIAKTMKP